MGIMKQSFKFWRLIHIWSGRIIVLFFLMWFISGLVLIYHPYPKLADKDIYSRMPLYSSNILEDSPQQDPLSIAQAWIDYPILKIDTLEKRSQWVLFPRYEKDLPIYKLYFADPDKTQLFISGTSFKPIQQTTRNDRIWSYFGAIPHKIYIPSLRRNTELWKKVVLSGGILCFIAAVSGMIIGIGILRRHYKKTGKIGNPYKKRAIRYHFGFGIVIGFFLITWGISGIFVMNKVPQWLSPTKDELSINQTKFWGKKTLPDSAWILEPEDIISQYPALKSFDKTSFGSFPVIKAIIGDSLYYFDASSNELVRMEIPLNKIEERVKKICGDSLSFTINKLDYYTQYYMPRLRGQANLPVYEVKINDKVNSTIYVDPFDGYIRYITDHKRIRKWVFEGLHYWNINGLYTHKILWTVFIWLICSCCIIVCITGAIITVKKIFR